LCRGAGGQLFGMGRREPAAAYCHASSVVHNRGKNFSIMVRNRNEESPLSHYRVNTLKLFSNDEFNGI